MSTFKKEFLQASQRSSEMGFLDLFVVAMVPVLKVLLITLVGLFLALDRIDLLGSTARPYLNNVSSIHVYRILCFIEINSFSPSFSP